MLARGRSNAAEAHATREQSFGINEKLGYWDDKIDIIHNCSHKEFSCACGLRIVLTNIIYSTSLLLMFVSNSVSKLN